MLSAIFDFLYFLAGRICGFLILCGLLYYLIRAFLVFCVDDKYDKKWP